jgi:preprotein translocase subunit SecA
MLRDGIGLRAYGQKNPLLEYKKEAYDMFNNMMYDIQSQTVKHLFRTKFGVQIVTPEQFNPNQSDETLIMNDNREENNDSNI